MLAKIFSWVYDNAFSLFLFFIFVVIVLNVAYILYSDFHQPETTTVMTQGQAEQVNEIKQTADNAQVPISIPQAKETVTQIKEIHTTEQVPVYIVQSSGATVKEDSEQAVKDNGADFAILATDTDKAIDISAIEDDTKVEISQYNIHAYKKHINTISYAPQQQIIGYEHQWKITKDGKYVGVGIDHDLDDNKTYIKATYSW